MGLLTRKPVFEVCYKVRLKPICSATMLMCSYKVRLKPICSATMLMCSKWSPNNWSATLLDACNKVRFSYVEAQILYYRSVPLLCADLGSRISLAIYATRALTSVKHEQLLLSQCGWGMFIFRSGSEFI